MTTTGSPHPATADGRSPLVLLAEDDADVRETTQLLLLRRGWRVTPTVDGVDALAAVDLEMPDIAVVDVAMPRLNGLDLTARLTALGVPVVLLTARSLAVDEVQGLAAGADDYVTKPFDADVLSARLQAVLRRRRGPAQQVVTVGDVRIDVAGRRVVRGGVAVPLSAVEFRVLEALLRNRGAVLSREQVVAMAWDSTWQDPRIVDTNIQRLRRKLGADVIETVRGFGYRIEVAPS
ncbi:response regulator transcription factor [Curtobacterium sp. ISL-83]|uniref:response regulator transcription factor n=1 Tax=Curtobacterium sp. ISL-83 TaxID=2819145 RepID=UPI001BE8F1BA|nr:response regulator transcription factor [Curtobacterium sp. ISL-83]MBT2503892.1 response regulator transcription factor [Curtobacterium sp. ISL-83]